MAIINYETVNCDAVSVDISDEVCLPYGFKHGDRVLISFPDRGISFKATVVGVVCCFVDKQETQQRPLPKALWFAKDGYLGRISFVDLSENTTWTLLQE